jgi:predicted alpha/beta-fold hydrolase
MPLLRASSAAVTLLIVSTFLLYCVYLRLPAQNTPFIKPAPQVPVTADRSAQHMAVRLPSQGQTTKSYWLQEGANPLAREGADTPFVHEDVDIVIIGSGITGSSAAHHIVQEMKNQHLGQLRVVVLEARDFCESHIIYLFRD